MTKIWIVTCRYEYEYPYQASRAYFTSQEAANEYIRQAQERPLRHPNADPLVYGVDEIMVFDMADIEADIVQEY